jgi:hypothetical protein
VSQIVRFMLYTRLASPIFTRVLARPIVRTTSAIGPFSCANTCSTAARTFDLAQTFVPLKLSFEQTLVHLSGCCPRCH